MLETISALSQNYYFYDEINPADLGQEEIVYFRPVGASVAAVLVEI